MSTAHAPKEIEYPESDGRPMGEADLHRDWMVRLYDLLRHRYQGQHVYVGSDLLVYYEEGNPKKFVVPDDFVVLDSDPGRRRTFKIWEEHRVPNVVIEVTSRKTKRIDEGPKPTIYAHIGVAELFLYDPTQDYLKPPLRGYRLVDGQYERIESDSTGRLACEELGVTLHLHGLDLVLTDSLTGETMLTRAEAAEAAAGAERARREAAEQRAAALEDELRRLREPHGRPSSE